MLPWLTRISCHYRLTRQIVHHCMSLQQHILVICIHKTIIAACCLKSKFKQLTFLHFWYMACIASYYRFISDISLHTLKSLIPLHAHDFSVKVTNPLSSKLFTRDNMIQVIAELLTVCFILLDPFQNENLPRSFLTYHQCVSA